MTTTGAGLRYGLLGLPLAFAALPLYVQLPAHYVREFGVPLGALGVLLLLARLGDAAIDPWIGRLVDRAHLRSPRAVLAVSAVAAAALAGGFTLLFFPAVRGTQALLAWAACALLLTFAAYSTLSVAHQSWGAMLGGDEPQRARIVGWREGLGLAGVLLASVLPTLAGWGVTATVLAVALAVGLAAWSAGPRPSAPSAASAAVAWSMPLRHAGFRRLLAIFMLNGIASAVPATLLLFFVRDRLQAPPAWEAALLGSYFASAAITLPLWTAAVARIGLARAWFTGMAIAIVAFCGTALLGPGDAPLFLCICLVCGMALGSDLVLPAALLAGVIADAGQQGRSDGLFFGWWNLATKLNLALAAGLALPVLAAAGYVPGERTPQALQALSIAYGLLPCVLKAAAAVALYRTCIRSGDHG